MRLSLAQKGPILPPPALDGPAGRVVRQIAAWPGIVAATHWHLVRRTEVDGADFYLGDEELGHVHLDGEIHLATVPALRASLVASDLARPFRYGGSYAGWVETSICSDAAADHALWLFDLNRRRLQGEVLSELLDRIRVRADVGRLSGHGA